MKIRGKVNKSEEQREKTRPRRAAMSVMSRLVPALSALEINMQKSSIISTSRYISSLTTKVTDKRPNSKDKRHQTRQTSRLRGTNRIGLQEASGHYYRFGNGRPPPFIGALAV